MTVPTNNEEAEALQDVMSILDAHENWAHDPDADGWVYDIQSAARAILGAGFRRPSASVDNAELIAEVADALWLFRTGEVGLSSADRRTPDYAEAIAAAQGVDAALSASQPREAEVTDDRVERAAKAIYPFWGERYPSGSQVDEIARAALSAALGGGDQ